MDRKKIIRGLIEIRDPEYLLVRDYLARENIDLVLEPARVEEYLNKQAESGVCEAQFALAKVLLTGLIERIDQSAAFEWCQRAAKGGYTPALILLSEFYSEGWAGLERNNARSLSLLDQGAEAGSSHALVLLAIAHLEGIRVTKDRDKGMLFLDKAAKQGDAVAQWLFGKELLESNNPFSVAEGVRWIRMASEQELASAHRELELLYADGAAGLPKDIEQSNNHRLQAEELENRDD